MIWLPTLGLPRSASEIANSKPVVTASAAGTFAAWQPLIAIGGFPPELSLAALGSAFVAALVITLVSGLLHRLVPGI